jgi:hypothetical protein
MTMPNTVNLDENLVADMEDTQVADTKVDDLEILEFFLVGLAAPIPALAFPLCIPDRVLGKIVLLLMQKPKPSLKTKAT